MKKQVLNYVGVLVLFIAVLVLIGFLANWSFTGYATFPVTTNYSYCTANITCGYSGWTSGLTYCLAANQTQNSGTCFDINVSNVTLDLQGFSIIDSDGPLTGSSRSIIMNASDITIRHGFIQNFTAAVNSSGTNDSLFYNLVIFDGLKGFNLSHVQNTNFSYLDVRGHYEHALSLLEGSHNTFSFINFSSNGKGLVLEYTTVLFNSLNHSIFLHNYITYGGDKGLHFINSYNTTVTNSILEDNDGDGIYLDLSNATVLSNNSLYNNSNGVYVYYTNNTMISNHTSILEVRGITFEESLHGEVHDSVLSNNLYDILTINSCTGLEIVNVTGSSGDPFYFANSSVNLTSGPYTYSGMLLCNASNSLIQDVTINPILQSNGIFAYDTFRLHFDNLFVNNTQYGLFFYVVSDSSINNSLFSNLNVDGILLSSSDDIRLTNITIDSTNAEGIDIISSDDGVHYNITVLSPGTEGISLSSSYDNVFTVTNISGSGNEALHLSGSDDNTFISTTVTQSTSESLYLESSESNNFSTFIASLKGATFYLSDYNSMTNFSIHNSSPHGLSLPESSYNTFIDGFLYNNSQHGVSLIQNSRNNVFVSVSSYYNSLDGFSILSSPSNSLYDVQSYNNSDQGINLTNSTGVLFRNLYLAHNGNSSSFDTFSVQYFYYNESENIVRFDIDSDYTLSDTIFNLSNYVTFGDSWIYVNSTGLPSSFNTSSQITINLTNSGITMPKYLINGSFCDDCNDISFNNGLFVFTVPHFTNYSIEDSTCGDSFCSFGESSLSCPDDCGSSGGSGGGGGGGGGGATNGTVTTSPSSSPPTTTNSPSSSGSSAPETEDPASDEGSLEDLPWIWILVIGSAVLLFLIVTVSVLIFLKNNSHGGVVVNVRRPPRAIHSKELDSSNKPAPSQPISKPQPKPQPVLNSPPKPHMTPSVGISSIREYIESQSRNSKVRIRYYLESGYMFLKRKDYKSAKQIYTFIFNEYKRLEFHDEILYRNIMRFRLGIP